jgi:hypothetical protein
MGDKQPSRTYDKNKKFISHGIPWSKEEEQTLKRLFLDQRERLGDVLKTINDKFWKGKPIRTYKGLEVKLERKGWYRKKHSNFTMGKISDKQKSIWEMKQLGGYSNSQIAEILHIPIGTVRSNYNYLKEHSMVNESRKNLAAAAGEEKMKLMNTNKELLDNVNQLQGENARLRTVTAIIVDNMQSVIKKLPPVKPPEIIIKKGMHKPEVAILELGDIHVGEKVLRADVANTTEYGFNEFLKRVDTLREGVLECVDIQRSKIPVDTLEINMLGDIVTGEDIYIGQMRNLDKDLMAQTFEGSHVLATKLIYHFAKYFKKIRIRCVWGNHGRGFGKPGAVAPRTNFDYIVYMFLKQMFADQHNVEFFIAECPLMLYQIPEAPKFTHLISHGNEVNSWMSLPFYGLQRDIGKYIQLFNMPVHFWHLGHHHNKATIDIPYGEQIINGTFVGGSELSVLKMKTKSKPKQLLFGFNNNHGITWRYDINLTPMQNMEIDAKGIYTAYNKQTFEMPGK